MCMGVLRGCSQGRQTRKVVVVGSQSVAATVMSQHVTTVQAQLRTLLHVGHQPQVAASAVQRVT